MATEADIRQILLCLWEEYPAVPETTEQRVANWMIQLGEFEYPVLNAALHVVFSRPERFAPTVGQFRNVVLSLLRGGSPPPLEGWELCCKAQSLFQAGIIGVVGRVSAADKYPNQPHITAHIKETPLGEGFFRLEEDRNEMALAWIEAQNPMAARAARAMGWARWYDSRPSDEMSWRAQFKQAYEVYAQRAAEKAALPPVVRAFIDNKPALAIVEQSQEYQAKKLLAGVAEKLSAPAKGVKP